MDKVCRFDDRHGSYNHRYNTNSSPPTSQTSVTTGGTKFCLVAVPSPEMQRPLKKNSTIDTKTNDVTLLQESAKKPDGLRIDNRISNPAYDGGDKNIPLDDSRADHLNSNNGDSSRIGRMLQTLRRDLVSHLYALRFVVGLLYLSVKVQFQIEEISSFLIVQTLVYFTIRMVKAQ